jgi:hypothetical protein
MAAKAKAAAAGEAAKGRRRRAKLQAGPTIATSNAVATVKNAQGTVPAATRAHQNMGAYRAMA